LLTESIATADDPREKLRVAIRSHLYLSEILRAWFYFSYMEAKHLGPEERQKAVESEIATEEMFRAIIEDGQRAGIFRKTSAQLAASLLKAMLQDWYLKRGKYNDRGMDVEHYADAVIEMTERYLGLEA
jgi:hypothetical protein